MAVTGRTCVCARAGALAGSGSTELARDREQNATRPGLFSLDLTLPICPCVRQFALLNVKFKSYIDANSFVQKGTSDAAEVFLPRPPPAPSALACAPACRLSAL